MAKVTCPECGFEFHPPVKNTLRLRALKLLARNSHTEMATTDIAREIRPDFDEMTRREKKHRVFSTYSFMKKMENPHYIKRVLGSHAYWRITESGIGYLLSKGLIDENERDEHMKNIEKRERAIAI